MIKLFVLTIIYNILIARVSAISILEPELETNDTNHSVDDQIYENSNDSYTNLIIQQYIILGWMSLVIVAFGIVGNLFTIKVLLHPNMKTAIDIHFIGLAIADLVSLVLILFIIPLRYILVSHKMLWYHEFHTIIFPLLYPVTIAFQLNSIFITVAASICRCITVYCPGLSQKMFTIKKSVL